MPKHEHTMISHDVKMKDSLKKTSFKLLAVLLLAPPAARHAAAVTNRAMQVIPSMAVAPDHSLTT